MSGARMYCGVCRMEQEGLRWHCRGCQGHHVVTDEACPETGQERPGVRMVAAVPEVSYRIVERNLSPACACGHRQGSHAGRKARCNYCECRRFQRAPWEAPV